MISAENRLLRIVFGLITSFMALLVFSVAFPAYALDRNYVISEYNGWIDVEQRIDFDKQNAGFDGFLKRIADEENGCFYLYFSFYDTELDGYDDDNTVISFDVCNDVNSYHFSVNRNGFVNTGDKEQKNIRLIYNFDNCSGSRCGGEILVGFELLNDVDRNLYNHVSCEYSGGNSRTSVLFYDYGFDMYAETTSEPSSHASSKSDKTTAVRTSSSHAVHESKTGSKDRERSTKYTPGSVLSRNGNKGQSSKFSGGNVYSSNETNVNHPAEDKAVVNERVSQGIYRMSKTAVITLSAAGVLFISGIVCIVAGAAMKSSKNESEESTDIISEK